MMKKIKTLALLAALWTTGFILSGCGDEEQTEDCIPADNSVIELTTNLSGRNFHIGDTVIISWKVDRNKISNGQIVVDISPDNGITWSAIPSAGIAIPQGQYQCMEMTWVIGNEGEVVDYEDKNDKCIIRIHEYSNNSNGVVFSQQKFSISSKK
ncbi:MAG: hypothetical protein GX640_23650 [Fibrobacter sp.]|nr:hypothetical protein [Fibrobacter sp.]